MRLNKYAHISLYTVLYDEIVLPFMSLHKIPPNIPYTTGKIVSILWNNSKYSGCGTSESSSSHYRKRMSMQTYHTNKGNVDIILNTVAVVSLTFSLLTFVSSPCLNLGFNWGGFICLRLAKNEEQLEAFSLAGRYFYLFY